MLSLSDQELDVLMNLAQPIDPLMRDAFLRATAAEALARYPVEARGPGLLHRLGRSTFFGYAGRVLSTTPPKLIDDSLRRGPLDASSPSKARTPMKNRASAAGFFLDAARCFLSIKAADRSFTAELPPVKQNVQAPRLFFIDYMSARLHEACGNPCDSVVVMLTAVAFKLRVSPGRDEKAQRDMVRKRREMAKRKNRAENRAPISAGARRN